MFGDRLIEAQRFLLPYIPAGAHILIVGGGTGKVLEDIATIHPSGLTVDYVDMSSEMMIRAQKRNAGGNKVNFVNKALEDILPPERPYDVVITAFFFDNFTQQRAGQMLIRINGWLAENGTLLYCDFRDTGRWGQKVLLRTMFLFFRVFCNIESKRLPDMDECFRDCGYNAVERRDDMKGFIVSVVYKRIATG